MFPHCEDWVASCGGSRPAPGYLQSPLTSLPSLTSTHQRSVNTPHLPTPDLTRSLSSSSSSTSTSAPHFVLSLYGAVQQKRLEGAMLKKMWEQSESWIPRTFSDWRSNYKMSLQSQLSTSKVLGWQTSLPSGPILLLAVVLLQNPTNGKRGCQYGGGWLVSKQELSNIEVGRREMLQ